MLDGEKLLELAKIRGVVLSEDVGEQALRGFANLAIDILEELVKDTETAIDDVAFAAVQGVAREMADKIEINL